MKAIVGEVDNTGLCRLFAPDLDPARVLGGNARPRPATLVWALLDEADAEEIRADVCAGRHGDACGVLLNRAVELLALGSVIPGDLPDTR
jgi:hypothetical protein